MCVLTGREARITGGRVESVPRWPRPWRGRGDGFGRLDGRTTLKTNDGAHIYVQYNGFLRVTEPVMRILGGANESTEFGDQYFFINPRMETGDQRYAWVNQTLFVGQGRALAGPAIEYQIYRVDK